MSFSILGCKKTDFYLALKAFALGSGVYLQLLCDMEEHCGGTQVARNWSVGPRTIKYQPTAMNYFASRFSFTVESWADCSPHWQLDQNLVTVQLSEAQITDLQKLDKCSFKSLTVGVIFAAKNNISPLPIPIEYKLGGGQDGATHW